MNISSIVVRTAPEHVKDVIEGLNKSGLCEVHFHDEQGKIIVTIEGKDVGEEIKKVTAIQRVEHVLSAEMIFSYNEEELENAKEFLEKMEGSVPDVLEEKEPDVSRVNYGGRLKM